MIFFHIIINNINTVVEVFYMDDKKRNILFSEEQIKVRVKELGEEISKDYEGIYFLYL